MTTPDAVAPIVALATTHGADVSAHASALPATEIIGLVGTGLGAGLLGGLLGIGGSVIMIPVLTLAFRHDQHLSQAAAMIVNVVVAVTSFIQHERRGAVPWPIVRRMVPAALVAIVVGVLASNLVEGTALKRFFGAFLVFVIIVNVQRLIAARRERHESGTESGSGDPDGPDPWPVDSMPTARAAIIVSSVVGCSAGLLGIGGGIIAVPLCQRFLHLPLRTCIAASAALMCITAPVGAIMKNLTLASGAAAGAGTPRDSIVIAGVLAPTAILGSMIGARLTHVLPVPWIRAVLVFLLTWAAIKFLGLR